MKTVRIIGNEMTGYRAVLTTDNNKVMAFGANRSIVMLIVSQNGWTIAR